MIRAMASKRSVATQSRRARVMKVVLDLHREGGPAAVTIARVREASGVSTGSLYHQFGDRDGLIDAAFEELVVGHRAYVSARLAREGNTAARYVRTLVAAHLRWIFDHPDEARALFRTRRALPPERAAAARRSTGAFVAETIGGLKKVARANEIVPLSGALGAAVLLGPAQEIARQWLAGRLPELDQEATIAALSEAAWRAMRQR